MGRALRVMLVSTSLMRGGAEIQVYLLAQELHRKGHAVEVVTMRDPEALDHELTTQNIPVRSLGMTSGIPDPRAVIRLARAVRSFRPDVVHSHMVHANLLARITRPFATSPVLISTAHNLSEGARWRELAYRITDPLTSITTNVSVKAVDRYVTVGAVPARRIMYMPNGLDMTPFHPDPQQREALRASLGLAEEFVWLAVGRLETQKDYPNLMQAVSNLVSETAHDPKPFSVLIVSDGPLRRELEGLRDDLGLSGDLVRFLGNRSDVPDLMRAADGYVMSSAWEGLPMVLLEAAAARLPIVATDVGGNGEVVEDGRSGYLVAPMDPAALSAAMATVQRLAPEERASLGARARLEVEQRYEIGKVVDGWVELYEHLLAKGGKSA